jgi:hypothetical protein
MTFTQSIPFTGNHSSIVIGKKGSTIKKLQQETMCSIIAKKPEPENGRPLPFFLVTGPCELQVLKCSVQIQGMLMKSLSRSEKQLNVMCTAMEEEIAEMHLKAESY